MEWEDFTLPMPGLDREYTFLQLSDAHTAVVCRQDEELDQNQAVERTKAWQVGELTPAEAFVKALEQADEEGLDGVILAGDCVDFVSPGMAAWIGERIAQTKTPVFYVFGNHEGGHYVKENPGRAAYPLFAELMDGNPAFRVRDFGTFLLVGVDDSDHRITQAQLEGMKEAISRKKPVLLVQHAPFYTRELLPEVQKVWGENGGEYFLFAKPQDRTDAQVAEYADLVQGRESPVEAVICGHVHFAHTGPVGDHGVQLVSAPTFTGYGRRIHLVRK